ncbi:MAG: tetratricopeptide repeat protein [Myxococcaceae bacterium]|nr:tetratricopeptide repeat protein [Myxococcaceae bacterium]
MLRGKPGPADEEFQECLSRGEELLAAGNLLEAREHLEAAHALQPRSEKAQNLLGLCCFKLGLLDRAAEIYERLVRENPVDATLRVNLGLVHLKSGALPRAVQELETATDLASDHVKAHNYLGLALAQTGEYARARGHFLQAGSEVMAEKMARAMAGESSTPTSPLPLGEGQGEGAVEPFSSQTPAPHLDDSWGAQFGTAEVVQAEAGPAPSPQPTVDPELDFTGMDTDDGVLPPSPVIPSTDGRAELAPPHDVTVDDADILLEPEVALEAPLEDPPLALGAAEGSRLQRGPTLGGLVEAVQLPAHTQGSVFEVREGALCILVRGELLTRLNGLLSLEGDVELTPERQRQRGRPVDLPFGEGDARLMRARGDGMLLLDGAGASFLPVGLGDESAYFREDALFALEGSVMFENGRISVAGAPDLALVYLRGAGQVLLKLGGPLRSVGVVAGRPVVVPLAHLVGWQGELSPRVVSLGGRSGAGVELTGSGFVLLALAAR